MNLKRIAAVPLALGLVLSFAACSGGNADDPVEKAPASSAAPEPEGEPDVNEGDGDSAKDDDAAGALDEALEDRDTVLPALEAALSKDNAEGNWQDDTLTMALDGDVEDLKGKFSHCRIVGNFLEEGDTLILEYPNGSVDCADIPELEGQLIW